MLRFNVVVLIIFVVALPHKEFAVYSVEVITWTHELISVEANSSDENLIKFDLKIEPIKRGVNRYSGNITLNADIEAGDNTMIEVFTYRSATGTSEYKLAPFVVTKMHLYDFINTFYKDIFMRPIAKCSNFPQFKDRFPAPLEKKTYTLKNCDITCENIPAYLARGYYKIEYIGSGKLEYIVRALIKVDSD